MLHLKKDKGTIKLIADTYVLTWAADKPYIYLDTPMGTRLAELFPYSSIHPLHGRDDTTSVSAWEVQEQGDEIILSSTATSSIWKRKIYRFRCKPGRFIYETAVEGSGYLSEVNYFGGYYSGQVRWGSGFFWSGQRFQRGFNPEPNTEEVNEFMSGEGSMIDLMGVPLPGKGHWFFTPPPFCYAFLGAPFKQDTGKQQGSIWILRN